MNLKKIQENLDYYKKFKSINYHEEKEKFLKAVEKGIEYNPQFIYQDDLDIEDYKDIQAELKKQICQDKIIDCFLKLYIEVVEMLIAWHEDDYKKITKISGSLFGSYKDFNLDKAIKKYKQLKTEFQDGDVEEYNSKQVGRIFLAEFKKIGMNDWRIIYEDNPGSEIAIYEYEKKLILSKKKRFSKFRLERIISHEIYGHAFQGYNGLDSGKYKHYFCSYIGTEMQYEGLAIFTEINDKNLNNNHIINFIKRFIIFMIANYLAASHNFYYTYNRIWELTGNKEIAFSAARKAKRGFRDTAKTGTWQKENSYLLGCYKIIKLIEKDKNNYNKLIQGCLPLEIISHIKEKKSNWQAINKFNNVKIRYFTDNFKEILNI